MSTPETAPQERRNSAAPLASAPPLSAASSATPPAAHASSALASRYPQRLAGVVQRDALDVAAFAGIILFSGMATLTLLANWPEWVLVVCVAGLAALALVLAYSHSAQRPDHLRAHESDRILRIANETVGYMRDGLTPQNAQAVCDIILRETPKVAAVAITDEHEVLGFTGVGADHHSAVRPIVTRATRASLERNATEVLASKAEIGCPEPSCPLHAAIVVPLEVTNRVVGTLKYYYLSERSLTETELTAAEGLARLLSTQLVIHELEEQAALATQMELKALQAQINPHFLFNTLNTIGAYVRTDANVARHLLRQFAAFYRRTLEHADEPITLNLELEFLQQYFELEQARFGERVQLRLNIDAAARDLPMPSFMLQPLVENSIAHGMRAGGEPLAITVEVTADELSDSWLFSVRDDGAGMEPERAQRAFEPQAARGLGVALRNVAERLRGFYGSESRLEIESALNQGTTVTFKISRS